LRLHVATGGRGWYRISTSLRHHLAREPSFGPTRTVGLHVEAERRTDRLYWGIGPRAPFDARVRFAESFVDAHLATTLRPWPKSRIDADLSVRRADFDDEHGELAAALRRGFVAPPGAFESGYTLARIGLRTILDTRTPAPLEGPPESDAEEPSSTGVRFGARMEMLGGPSVDDSSIYAARPMLALLRQSAKLTAAVDVWRRRVVSVSFAAERIDPQVPEEGGRASIPFTELASLGGGRPLRGFLPGRLLGRSALSSTVEYAWPIWIWLEGVIHYGFGNVFGPSFEGASLGALRQSFGFGMRTNVGTEHGFELLVAAGTRPLDEGGAPESLRLVVGSQLDW